MQEGPLMKTLRNGSVNEENCYLEIQFRVFPHERADEDRHRKYFAQKIQHGELLVLEYAHGRYIGHFSFAKMISSPFPNCIYLVEGAILEEHRRVGKGTKLMGALIAKCRAEGLTQIRTNTAIARNNRDAINIYHKMGFTREGRVHIQGVPNMLLRLHVGEESRLPLLV